MCHWVDGVDSVASMVATFSKFQLSGDNVAKMLFTVNDDDDVDSDEHLLSICCH